MPSLSAITTSLLTALYWAALFLYLIALVASFLRPDRARGVTALAVSVHLSMMVGRGLKIGFFPFTSKTESFSAAAVALAGICVLTWRRSRSYTTPQLVLAIAAMAAAGAVGLDLRYPPPLMRTPWYPLHVPLSFVCFALWAASASAGLAWIRDRSDAWLDDVDKRALQGFGLWSFAMFTGGVWGVVSWGAYFLWDPKMLWSVILWFHYASFAHLRLAPALRGRPWVRPALALVGLLWVMVAYVGTSYFFGRSSHAF